MRLLVLILTCLLVSFPTTLQAQSLEDLLKDQPALELVPKPTTTDCVPDAKCLDFDNFKLYLQMRVQYVWLFKVHTGLFPSIVDELKKGGEASEAAEKIQAERALRVEKAYDDLFKKYEGAALEAEEARGLSIFGGGLPWMVTTLVVGVAGGIYLGTLISN